MICRRACEWFNARVREDFCARSHQTCLFEQFSLRERHFNVQTWLLPCTGVNASL